MVSRDLGFRIPGAIAFCLVVIGYFFYKEYQKRETKRGEEKNINANFSGKIDSLYRDYSNHGVTILVLSDKTKLEYNMYQYSRFRKNDSIVKRKGEESLYIYRDGDIKVYKY